MNLPADVARCPGAPRVVKDGEWPFPAQMDQCGTCERRRQAVADYMAANTANVQWMEPIQQEPCPERLERKK